MQNRDGTLPRTRRLALVLLSGLVIALLVGIASLAGILYRTELYPDGIRVSFTVTDAINLAVGLPLLLGSIWLMQRSKLLGLVCLPGALFFFLYIYLPYLIAVPFNQLFLVYLAIVTLSAYTLVVLVTGIAGDVVRQTLQDLVPARTSGGILVALALLIFVRQTALVVTALANQTPVAVQELAVWIDDLAIASPFLLVVGIQLWRRRAFGYAAGGGILLAYGSLALGVIPLLVAESIATAVPIDVGGIVVLTVMALVCLVLFMFFVRAFVRPPGATAPPVSPALHKNA